MNDLEQWKDAVKDDCTQLGFEKWQKQNGRFAVDVTRTEACHHQFLVNASSPEAARAMASEHASAYNWEDHDPDVAYIVNTPAEMKALTVGELLRLTEHYSGSRDVEFDVPGASPGFCADKGGRTRMLVLHSTISELWELRAELIRCCQTNVLEFQADGCVRVVIGVTAPDDSDVLFLQSAYDCEL